MAKKPKYRVFSSLDCEYWEVRRKDTNRIVFQTKSLMRALAKAISLNLREK